jgi:hypothetical protein
MTVIDWMRSGRAVLLVASAVFVVFASGAVSAEQARSATTVVPTAQTDPTVALTEADRSRTYSDRVGDNEEFAPDFSETTVSLVGDRLSFRIGLANIGPGLIDDEFVVVYINSDRNASTGCAERGADVAMAVLGVTGGDEFARIARCVGGEMDPGGRQGSFRFSLSSGGGLEGPGAITFAINASELGSTNFTFLMGSVYEGIYGDYFDEAGPYSFGPSSRPSPGPPSSSGIVIARHPDVRAEATGPTGARVRYARARVRGAKTVTYSKPSGSVFPLGRTTVTVTARNGRRVARSRFAVVVADTTPPTISPLPGYTTNATEPTRATVTFPPPTASDRVDRNVAVACTPTSGSVLAPGATTVSCSARDRSGNTSNAVSRISVPLFSGSVALQTNTALQYDQAGRLIAATTSIALAVPAASDGSPTAYTWTASSGTLTGNGATASWARQIDASGQVTPSALTVTLTYGSGRTEVLTIQFP